MAPKQGEIFQYILDTPCMHQGLITFTFSIPNLNRNVHYGDNISWKPAIVILVDHGHATAYRQTLRDINDYDDIGVTIHDIILFSLNLLCYSVSMIRLR